MEDFRKITVRKGSGHKVSVNNPTTLEMIGSGDQGAVFLLSPEYCVKIYGKSSYARQEARAYRACKRSMYFPRLVESGSNYNIMEYVKGMSLKNYIRQKGEITFSITVQFVMAIKEMKKQGFSKLDIPPRHIIVTDTGHIKIIDLVNSYRTNKGMPFALLTYLRKQGLLETFLSQVYRIDQELYQEWAAFN